METTYCHEYCIENSIQTHNNHIDTLLQKGWIINLWLVLTIRARWAIYIATTEYIKKTQSDQKPHQTLTEDKHQIFTLNKRKQEQNQHAIQPLG